MSRRPCIGPSGTGCPVGALVKPGQSRCNGCRNPQAERRYVEQHKQDRAYWSPIVARGKTPCRRCRCAITSGQPWDVGRPDKDCDYPTAPEHRACNRATAGHANRT